MDCRVERVMGVLYHRVVRVVRELKTKRNCRVLEIYVTQEVKSLRTQGRCEDIHRLSR